jgi:predicted kinase
MVVRRPRIGKMTEPDPPLLVVITGPPATGKTTLARALADGLGLPLIAKDTVKETLFDALGTGDRPWSRRLGVATYTLLFTVAAEVLRARQPLVLEANLTRGTAEAEFAALPPYRLLQIVCTAPDDVVLARYRERALGGERHSGHLDLQIEDEVAAALRERRHDALDLDGKRIYVDTTTPASLEPIFRTARRLLDAGGPSRRTAGASGPSGICQEP